MSTTTDYFNKVELIYLIADMDISNVLPLVNQWLDVRKEFAIRYLNSKDEEPIHLECISSIEMCNNNIKKLLGIL
jgi:hypothetical protein